MSGFSLPWLDLRATADARARAPDVAAAVASWAERRAASSTAPLCIVDLGAGTGATVRALAPSLPRPQSWLLVDDDAELLAVAERRLAGGSVPAGIDLAVRSADLAGPDLGALVAGADLVTASALFDLVSLAWCQRLFDLHARPGAALYAALTYDGRVDIRPAHDDDPAIFELFNRHQTGNKGFGPALGPAAPQVLVDLARASGGEVVTAASDWRLGGDDAALQVALINGWTDAAQEIKPSWRERIAAWRGRRRGLAGAHGLDIVVGHLDVLATWS
jgi:hypothetical protein